VTKGDPLWAPTIRQSEFLEASEEEVLYGGAAGGGKTDALLLDALGLWQKAPLVPRYRALIVRRSFPQLREVIDRTKTIYPAVIPGATYNEASKEWRFPSGAKIIFGFLERDSDCDQYQGQEYQYIGFEELTQWGSPYCFDYMRTRLRGTELVKLMRATCNPGGIGAKWVQKRFKIPDSGEASESREEFQIGDEAHTIRRRFIPARVTDNPHLPTSYQANLMAQPDSVRAALLDGRWNVLNIPGAIYKSELDAVRLEGRLCGVPYDPSVPVHVAWDLGIGDSTALWCAQLVGREIHLIDYYESSGEALPHYFGWLESRPYRYGDDFFPHDAAARELGTGKSREEIARTNGRKVRMVSRLGVEDGIHATRLMLARSWFDEEKTRRGWECIENYRRDYNDKMGEFKASPVHDWSSHGSDALRCLSVGLQEKVSPKIMKTATVFRSGPQSWMSR
jgi:hypothetical protein